MTLCIEVALKPEAQPLIDAFNLRPLPGNPLFPIWENEEIKLIISGVGKIKSGAACSYLAGIYRDEDIYGWLNVGIAGHRTLPIGTPVIAHTIIDELKRIQFFPSFAFKQPCTAEICLTVESPEHLYERSCVYDMEAAGFYAIASKISPLEMIHVFKVISDNADHSTKEITKQKVHALIEKHVGMIQDILKEMQTLIQEIAPIETPFLDELMRKWHFTTCETHQLKKLLQRWNVLCPDQVLLSHDLLSKKAAKDVLSFLEDQINALPVC